uniref:Uncharacterized protein n=1 Tax=Ascaris lumbricoides TaxID=6252 RepID=A0A0M3IJP8_ASCLU
MKYFVAAAISVILFAVAAGGTNTKRDASGGAAISVILFAITAGGTNTKRDASGSGKSPCIKNLEPMANIGMEIGRGAVAWHKLRTRKEPPCEFISQGAKLTRVILIVFHIALGIIAILLFCKEQMNIFNEREIIRVTKGLSKESSVTPSTRSTVTLNREKQQLETIEAMRIARQLYRLRDRPTRKGRREKNKRDVEVVENLNADNISPQNNAKEQSKSKETESTPHTSTKNPHKSLPKSYSQSSEDDSNSSLQHLPKTTSKNGSESSEKEINKDSSRRSSAGHESSAERENIERKTRRRLAWDEVEMRRHGLVTRDCTHLAPPAETPPSVVVSEYSRFGQDVHSVSIDFSSLEDSISTAQNALPSSTTFHDDWAMYIPQ